MKQFHNDQQVRLVNPPSRLKGMQGWTGTVVRLRRNDNGAWVRMDRILPSKIRVFDDPDDTRFCHLLLFPDECKPLVPITHK